MNKEELSLLLFLETQAVDNCGKVRSLHMNENDFKIAGNWNNAGYIQFGRLKTSDFVDGRTNNHATHWCRLSDRAWADAHAERKARAARIESVKDYPK